MLIQLARGIRLNWLWHQGFDSSKGLILMPLLFLINIVGSTVELDLIVNEIYIHWSLLMYLKKSWFRTLITCQLSLTFALFLHGQGKWEKDSTAITSYADKFVIKLNVDTQTSVYDLRNIDGQDLRLTHNNTYRLYLSLDYQFFGLSFGIAPDIFGGSDNINLKGESSFTDFRFRAEVINPENCRLHNKTFMDSDFFGQRAATIYCGTAHRW